MRIAVVGAGITGLTTALSLDAAGLDCVVFEAVAQPAPLGVGINLLPHDARAFAYHLATAASLDAGLAAYEAERRPATERIVLMNRANGPDQVMELAEQRAPNLGDDLDARLPMAERKAIADEYKQVAGFDPRTLNARASYSVDRGFIRAG